MTFPEPYATWFPDATFDGSYGRTEADLRAVRPVPAPPGFADRWRRWRREAAAVDAAPVVLSTSEEHGRRVSVVEHAGVDGVRLRAWVVEPLDGPPRAGVVHGHGYGGRDAVDLARVPDDVAAIYPVARGLGVLNAGIGAPEPTPEHVLAGIDDPERYVLGLCALALPWDDRFVGATLIVPSFGQYDERLAVPCRGSGETVRQHVLRHPEAREVLRWFDSSTAIGFTEVPVRVEAALWDQYVPPQGQFAVAAGARDLDLAVLPAGHAEYPGSADVTEAAIRGGRAHLERVLAG